MTVFVANANMLTLSGLTSAIDGVISNATVTVTVADAAGVAQTGVGWPTFPLTMEPVAGAAGDYRVIFSADIPWEPRKTYVAQIDAESLGEWHLRFKPAVRYVNPVAQAEA